jgi:NADH dehydrogenase
VLERLDVAATTTDPETRTRALTFVFVGGGYAGIEALAEMEDMAHDALQVLPELEPSDMHWVLVEATKRILPEVDPDMGAYTVQVLLRRNMDIRLDTRLESCVGRRGEAQRRRRVPGRHDRVDRRGQGQPDARQHRPAARREGPAALQHEAAGRRTRTGRWSRVHGAPATAPAVPDLTATRPGTLTSPSAQHSVRQAPLMADNIVATIRGRTLEGLQAQARRFGGEPGAAQGRRAGVRIKLKGFPAWFMHRTYHVSRIPA